MGQKLDETTLIEVVESIHGLKIEIWGQDYQHALERHPEVSLDRIRKTLQEPMRVIKSLSNNNVCLFYALEINDPEFGVIYFCVVVSVLGKGSGKLVTAYETTYIKKGEPYVNKNQ
ncbi:MAG: hypothetical protein HQK52_22750 [Oligoflexia bacterium]|nr:hypothetical protein [Oligoflexia bacterium]